VFLTVSSLAVPDPAEDEDGRDVGGLPFASVPLLPT